MIKPLTSLRFFFALMVFFSHLAYLGDSDSYWVVWLYELVFHEGYIGVSFFFILSGFVLSFNYQDALLSGRVKPSSFYAARFSRIYPLHLLSFLLAVPLSIEIFADGFEVWVGKMIANLTLTQSFFPNSAIYFSFNAPSWSISDEFFFYLMFPTLILFLSKLRATNKNFITALFLSILPLALIVVPSQYFHALFYINPFFRIFDFALGIILFNIYKHVKSEGISKFNYNVLEFGAVALLVLFFIIHPYVPQVLRYSLYYWIPMSSIILVFSFQKGWLSAKLSNKHLIFLGEISFGFYMFHTIVLGYWAWIWQQFGFAEKGYLFGIGAFIITTVLSLLSYIHYEKPLNKFLKERFSSWELRISSSVNKQ